MSVQTHTKPVIVKLICGKTFEADGEVMNGELVSIIPEDKFTSLTGIGKTGVARLHEMKVDEVNCSKTKKPLYIGTPNVGGGFTIRY